MAWMGVSAIDGVITWVSCPYCGYGLPTYVIDDNYKFCPHCGRRVIKDAWVPEFYEEE